MKETLNNFLRANGTVRALAPSLFEQYFLPYGCWCNFDDQSFNVPGRGRGAPVDRWDENCRQLQEGYRCAMMDAESAGQTCNPWEESYLTLSAGMDENLIRPICEMTN